MKPVKRGLAILLSCLLVLGFPMGAAAKLARDGGPAEADSWPPSWGKPGLPVLLVSSPGSDPERIWGGPGGLQSKLEAAGYGVWIADLSAERDPDPERLAGAVIAPLARRVLAATGAERLHVVGHGLGALAARFWAESEGAGQVATLVMLGCPNHGSFALNLLRLAATLSAREAGLVGPGSVQQEPWSYVWERAASTYQPLYARYVGEYRLGPPGQEWLSGLRRWLGRLPFEGWLAQEEGELFDREFRQAQRPAPGGTATLAYYHALALNVARAEGARRAVRGEGLVSALLEDPLLRGEWEEMLRHYGRKVAWWLGRQFLDFLTRKGQQYLLEQAPHLLGVDPFSPGLEKLLEEHFYLPLGPGVDGRPRYERLLGNCFLQSWNERASRGEGAGSRYVIVAGRVPNLWKLAWGPVGDNDFWTRVESCYLPLGPDDSFFLSERGVASSHSLIPRERNAQDLVIRELRFRPQRAFHPRSGPRGGKLISWSERAEFPLSPWMVRYVGVDASCLGEAAGELRLELETRAPSQAGPPLAWVWVADSRGWQRQSAQWEGGHALLRVSDFGSEVRRVYLGSRIPPSLERGLVASYRGACRAEMSCRVEFIPLAPAQAPSAPARALPPPTPGSAVAEQEERGSGSSSSSSQVPVIRAVLKTKQTTHKEERRTHHARWEWDFGDGSLFRDDDPSHLVSSVRHTFSAPGAYTVRACAYANTGQLLREQTWRVRVVAGEPIPSDPGSSAEAVVRVGEPWEARLETAREPKLKVTIHSPKEWMVGLPARIRVSVDTETWPEVVAERVEVDPGREFDMIWERPGIFPVKVAVTVSLRYRFPEREYTLRNTYLYQTEVKVLTTAGTD